MRIFEQLAEPGSLDANESGQVLHLDRDAVDFRPQLVQAGLSAFGVEVVGIALSLGRVGFLLDPVVFGNVVDGLLAVDDAAVDFARFGPHKQRNVLKLVLQRLQHVRFRRRVFGVVGSGPFDQLFDFVVVEVVRLPFRHRPLAQLRAVFHLVCGLLLSCTNCRTVLL